MMPQKSDAQFWTALVAVVGLTVVSLASLIVDAVAPNPHSSITPLLCGGLVSLGSCAATWLFSGGGNGNGNGRHPPQQPAQQPPEPPA
jgi:hypothetical protein